MPKEGETKKETSPEDLTDEELEYEISYHTHESMMCQYNIEESERELVKAKKYQEEADAESEKLLDEYKRRTGEEHTITGIDKKQVLSRSFVGNKEKE